MVDENPGPVADFRGLGIGEPQDTAELISERSSLFWRKVPNSGKASKDDVG